MPSPWTFSEDDRMGESAPTVEFSCAGPALCQETLASLKKLDGLSSGPVLQPLIEVFLSESALHLRALAASLDADHEAEFRSETHMLKGSCQVIGALRMDRLCQRLLDLGPEANVARPALVAELALAFEEVRRRLASWA